MYTPSTQSNLEMKPPGNEYSEDVIWIGRADCRQCAKRKDTLFSALTSKEISELPSPIDQFEFPANHTIYEAGGDSEDVYTIRDGFVKAVAQTTDGGRRIVRLYSRGDVIGLEKLIDDGYQHTIMTMGTVNVCRMPVKTIKRLLVKSHKLNEQIMRQWQTSLKRADYWLIRLTTGNIEERLSWFLKLLVDLNESENQRAIQLPTNLDMAGVMDTTVESVSRAVAKLKRLGVLKRISPRTYQCDVDRL